jgi:hypothetical protein
MKEERKVFMINTKKLREVNVQHKKCRMIPSFQIEIYNFYLIEIQINLKFILDSRNFFEICYDQMFILHIRRKYSLLSSPIIIVSE